MENFCQNFNQTMAVAVYTTTISEMKDKHKERLFNHEMYGTFIHNQSQTLISRIFDLQ